MPDYEGRLVHPPEPLALGELGELVDFSAATLAPYKRPRLLHVVDELPRNAMGKVVRNQLGPA